MKNDIDSSKEYYFHSYSPLYLRILIMITLIYTFIFEVTDIATSPFNIPECLSIPLFGMSVILISAIIDIGNVAISAQGITVGYRKKFIKWGEVEKVRFIFPEGRTSPGMMVHVIMIDKYYPNVSFSFNLLKDKLRFRDLMEELCILNNVEFIDELNKKNYDKKINIFTTTK